MDAPEQSPDEAQANPRLPADHPFSAGQKALILALNALPLAQVATALWVALWPWAGVAWRVPVAILGLYLLPALVARFIVSAFPFRATLIPLGSSEFFKWWALLSLQVLFCRLPALEELLRIVPSAYSAWLRLWGSRIGRLVYWAPGTRVLDRSFLRIGDDVVFGAGVRLNPHVMARNAEGRMELILAPVEIGDRAVIGGYSLLTAGTRISADGSTRACLMLPPFTKWSSGKRVRE